MISLPVNDLLPALSFGIIPVGLKDTDQIRCTAGCLNPDGMIIPDQTFGKICNTVFAVLKRKSVFQNGSEYDSFSIMLLGKKTEEKSEITLSDAVAYAQKLIDGGMRPTEAAKQAAAMAGLKKNDIYKELM